MRVFGVRFGMLTMLSVLFLLGGCASTHSTPREEAVTISSRQAGGELRLPGILHAPSGAGRFGAVVMLCGCAGYAKGPDARQQSAWAARLVGWGYVALQLDSFTPRGFPRGVCKNGGKVNALERARDAYAAKSYLASLSFVDPERIAVMGWSHGGWAVMEIVDRYKRRGGVSPFKAAVGYYPLCRKVVEPDTPLLVLIGAKDDWSSPSACECLKKNGAYRGSDSEFSLKVYPDAYHAFDVVRRPIEVLGHHLEYDPAAASDAIGRTKDFLARYIGT